jgi:hypothetical protein
MAAKPRDPKKQKSEPEKKKKSETVQLSAEELRKIAGGAGAPSGNAGPKEFRKLP